MREGGDEVVSGEVAEICSILAMAFSGGEGALSSFSLRGMRNFVNLCRE